MDNWKKTLREGNCIDVFWSQNARWYHSKILSKDGDLIKVHYNGWSASFDEKIDITNPSRFIYPEYTFTTERRSKKSATTSDGLPNLTTTPYAIKGWANKFLLGSDESATDKGISTSSNPTPPTKGNKKQNNTINGSSGGSSSSSSGDTKSNLHDDDVDHEGCKIFRASWSKVVDAYQKQFEQNFVQCTDRLKLRFINGQKVEVQGKQKSWFLISFIDSMAQRRTQVKKLGSAVQFNGHIVMGDCIKEAYKNIEVGDNIILHVVNKRKEWLNYDELEKYIDHEIANSNPHSAERKKELMQIATNALKKTGKTLSENIAIVVQEVLLEEDN